MTQQIDKRFLDPDLTGKVEELESRLDTIRSVESVVLPLTGDGSINAPLKLVDADEDGKTLVWQNGSWVIGEAQGSGESSTPTGTAGGDLGGTYPNPTVQKIQGRAVANTFPPGGHVLIYNSTSNQWEPAPRQALLAGNRPPNDLTDGIAGDFWINTKDFVVYGPKTSLAGWGEGQSLLAGAVRVITSSALGEDFNEIPSNVQQSTLSQIAEDIGAVLAQGNAIINTDLTEAWVWDGVDSWTNVGKIVGAVGPVGPEGPVGPRGSRGFTGSRGPQGPQGPQGPEGVTGPKGDTGVAATIIGSVAEVLPEPQGQLNAAFPEAESGDAIVDLSNNTLWIYNGPEWFSAGGIVGQQGLQGPKGNTGDAGPEGPEGPEGAQGPEGPEGPVGPKGDTGPQGLTGPQGPKGDTGVAVKVIGTISDTAPDPSGALSDAFPQAVDGDGVFEFSSESLWVLIEDTWTNVGGISGPQGPQGIPGPEGLQGPQGLQGAEGPEGPQGPEGVQGSQGNKGEKGDKGDPGPALELVSSPLQGEGTSASPLGLIPGTENGQVLLWENGTWILGEAQGTGGGGGVPSGTAGGDLSGEYPNPSVVAIQGRAVANQQPTDNQTLRWSQAQSSWIVSDFTSSGPASGDLSGSFPNPTVSGIQGKPVDATEPQDNWYLKFSVVNGVGFWTAAALPSFSPSGDATGDLGGTYPSPSVNKIRGRAVAESEPDNGQFLAWNQVQNSFVFAGPEPAGSAGGDLGGSYPNPSVQKIQGKEVSNAVPTAEQTLVWDDLTSRWIPAPVRTLQGRIVSSDMPASGEFLKWNGISWLPSQVDSLQGRGVSPNNPVVGQTLAWNGNAWAPSSITQVQVSTSIAFAGVAAEGAATLVSSFYVPATTTLASGNEGSLALIGGATTLSQTTLSLIPLGSNVPAVSWTRTGLLDSATLDSEATLTQGWYDIVLSGESNLTAFARGIYLVSSGGE